MCGSTLLLKVKTLIHSLSIKKLLNPRQRKTLDCPMGRLPQPRHNRKKMPTDNTSKGRCTQAKTTKPYEESQNHSKQSTNSTPTPFQIKKKKKEEITSAKLEIIEQSEKNFEISSVRNRKSFKCLKKK